MDGDEIHTQPAHRPSRRSEIIDAAIRLFARKGFVDAAITDVAEEADVVVTAVYYHFSGKEELYAAAVERVFHSISAVAAEARPDRSDPASVAQAIDPVWTWIDKHPDEATLLYLQLPGATPQIARMRQEFEEGHVDKVFVGTDTGNGRRSAAERGERALVARTLIDLLISIHTMRLLDGPLSTHNPDQLRAAVHRLAERLVTA
jgi:AcrR family transcriptional regulator